MPLAIAAEYMAELVRYGWHKWSIAGIESLRAIKGIIIQPGKTSIRISAAGDKSNLKEDLRIVETRIHLLDNPKMPTHTAKFILQPRRPAPEIYDPAGIGALEPYPHSVPEAYARFLLHGPRLQHITAVEGISENSLRCRLKVSSPSGLMDKEVDAAWAIDPVIVDCFSQMANFWSREKLGSTSFPTGFARYRFYQVPASEYLMCDMKLKAAGSGNMIIADIWLWNENREIAAVIERMEFSSSPELNYLSEEQYKREMIL